MVEVPWDEALSIAGAMLQPVPDLYPPRWQYTQFPGAELLDQLRTAGKVR